MALAKTFGTAPGGYSPAYGGVPNLPTGDQLSGNLTNIINQSIPGFSGLTKSATGIIGSALSGALPPDVQNLIKDQSAARAVSNGMPGSSNTNGALFGNATLRDLGLTSLDRQDTGIKDLLGLLQGYSGTAMPNFGQLADQSNARAQYAAAPNPQAAASEQERLYAKYSNPAAGIVPSQEETPWMKKSRTTSNFGSLGFGGPLTIY